LFSLIRCIYTELRCSDSVPERNARTLDVTTWKRCSRRCDLIWRLQPAGLPRGLSSGPALHSRRVHEVSGHLQTSCLVEPNWPDPDFFQLHDWPIYSVPLHINAAASAYIDTFYPPYVSMEGYIGYISAMVAPIGVKFCMTVHIGSPFGGGTP